MHSLKNTIVAVGLLGLSFVFYQLSEPKNQSDDSLDVVAADLDAMITDESETVAMPDLGVSQPVSSPADFEPAELPPPSSRKNKPKAALPAPVKSNPFSETAKPSGAKPAATFQPRPEAKFDFANNSNPSGQGVRPASSAGGFEPVASDREKRDQGLMTALDQSEKSARDGGFGLNAQLPNSRQPAPTKNVSTFQDSAVVGASSIDVGRSTNNDFGVPALNRDPYSQLSFREAWPVVDKLIVEEDFRSALKLLTRFYHDSELTGPQRQRLVAWLDGLASKVVFSAEHHLHPAYLTREGDSLADLRTRWGIPGQLIYNVNKEAISNPMLLAPGTELKKIAGPFNAVVELTSGTVTAYVDGLYAGRFASRVGISGNPQPGDYRVLEKNESGHEWKDVNGSYPPMHPKNQYGRFWIGLEGQLCIHAIAADRQAGHLGCVGLRDKEAKELFSFLSRGSTVTIK